LYGENVANINMLRGIFNEEYNLNIDDSGNLNFMGEDGEISLNDLPDFYQKDYKTADTMMTMGVNAYKNALNSGLQLKPDTIQYFQYQNKLKTAIDQSGNAGIMSILHDGLVGDIVMADDPSIQKMLQGYKDGNISFTELRDGVVDNYMQVLIKQSQIGVSQRKVKPKKSSTNPSKNPTETEIKSRNKVQLLVDAWNDKNIDDIQLYLPTSVTITEEDGVYYIGEKIIDLNNKGSFKDILRYAKIDPLYWPPFDQDDKEQTSEEETNINEGAADNF